MVRQTLAIAIRLVLLLTLLGGMALITPTLPQTPVVAKNERSKQEERNGQHERKESNGNNEQKKPAKPSEQNDEDEPSVVEEDEPSAVEEERDEPSANEEETQEEPAADGEGGVAAAAPQTVYTEGAAGSARLQDYGDHVYLCDHAKDKHGVGVYVTYDREDDGSTKRITKAFWYGGGPNPDGSYACRDINLAIREWTTVSLQVCLADHTEEGGQKPDPIVSTCDNDAFLNDG